jgi:hypothetical protein
MRQEAQLGDSAAGVFALKAFKYSAMLRLNNLVTSSRRVDFCRGSILACYSSAGKAPGTYRKRFGGQGISPVDFAAKDGLRQKKHLFEAYPHRG